jgi:hypothetical protein
VTNCLDVAPPFSAVEPLPARSRPALTVRWAGTDAGSGVASYDLYVAQDGGPYRLWLPATPATAAQFAGRAGSTYAFASVAVDGVGNREPFPAQPDAVTTLVAVTPPLITSARVEGAFFRLRVDGLEPGQTYVVERLLDLSAPDWVWANEFTPEGTVADHGLPLEPQWSQAFFRLRLR